MAAVSCQIQFAGRVLAGLEAALLGRTPRPQSWVCRLQNVRIDEHACSYWPCLCAVHSSCRAHSNPSSTAAAGACQTVQTGSLLQVVADNDLEMGQSKPVTMDRINTRVWSAI